MPLKTPFVHVRACETQEAGGTTVADWYAVTEDPFATVPPHGSGHDDVVGGPTGTVTDCTGEVPPGPVHWKVNVASAVRVLLTVVPESGDVRFDQGPPAVQLVALVELQVIVVVPPYGTGLGETVNVVVGGVFDPTITELVQAAVTVAGFGTGTLLAVTFLYAGRAGLNPFVACNRATIP